MREIILSPGEKTIVSVEDFDYLNQWIWCPSVNKLYASNNSLVLMHRVIAKRMGLSTLVEIDHRDRNGWNNQRNNLREATHAQNIANAGIRPNNTSGYKGVTRRKDTGKWQAYLHHEYKKINLGCFDCIINAAKAYDYMARQLFCEFAVTNFPKPGDSNYEEA